MFLEVFVQGLRDGLSFLPMVNALVFFVFLMIMGRTKSRIFIIGFFFILSLWAAHLLVVFGIFDSLLNQKATIIVTRIIYLLLALGFVVLGCCYLFDWYRYQKNSNPQHFFIKPAWLNKKDSESRGNILKFELRELGRLSLLSVAAIMMGSVLMVLSSISIDDYGTFIDFMGWAEGGHGKAVWLLTIYMFALTFPIFCVWILTFVAALSAKFNRVTTSVTQTSLLKIIAAAIFLASGIGLGYTFLRS